MFVGLPPAPPNLRPDQRAEVAGGIAYLEAQSGPVTAAHLTAWLAPINGAVRNPQSREDLAIRVAAMCDLLSDPAGVAPEGRRTVGRVWRDLCVALGITQDTYAHLAPEEWEAKAEAE
jgi:hypothetical protein